MRIVARGSDPGLVALPWHLPLEEWGDPYVVPVARGLSRHVVRIVRVGGVVCAVKETQERPAWREYDLLGRLGRLDLPTVVPLAVVTDRTSADGEDLGACLVTQFLPHSLPYRVMFSRGLRSESMPALVDAMVVLLVRLHLDGFFWGDVSLSNVLFRRSAGEFAAYLVDAETGDLQPTLSTGQREHDLVVASENVFGEMLDLQGAGLIDADLDLLPVVERLREQYDALWGELTATEEFSTAEMWRIERRAARLNELGFDIEELDITTADAGSTVRVRPRVVEAGHHRHELRGLTGLDVEEAQARRLLNDLASFTAATGSNDEDRHVVASVWLSEVYEPVVGMVPRELRGRLEPAEVFHEILEHRWYLSERHGRQIDIFDTAADYVRTVLPYRSTMAPESDEIDDGVVRELLFGV
ncbi:DUF4032 domain-containing protein [Nocardioidaceae bacterium]|nr:DUF4032 domain-containing protein [Nocardioidaceae bacterium]